MTKETTGPCFNRGVMLGTIRRSPRWDRAGSGCARLLILGLLGLVASCAADRGRTVHAPGAEGSSPAEPAPGPVPEFRVLAATPPDEMYFRHYGTNPTIDAQEERVSTFAIDTDTASYTLARAVLNRGELPAKASIRVEEFLNAFDYGYEAPTEDAWSLESEAFPSPHRPGYHVLRLGFQTRGLAPGARRPVHLVLAVDLSPSMSKDGRLEAAKAALGVVVDALEGSDRVAIVSFADRATLSLPPTPADGKEEIHRALGALRPAQGPSHLEAGLTLAYHVAGGSRDLPGDPRILLFSHGITERGLRSAEALLARMGETKRRDIALTTLGLGMAPYDDVMLEQLAQWGGGQYHYLDALSEARRLFVRQRSQTLHIAAKNVKLQVEFDPEVVSRYRLIGYENRLLEGAQLEDDRAQGRSIGVGASVTVLFEVKLRHTDRALGEARVAYEGVGASGSSLWSRPLPARILRPSPEGASPSARLALAVAGFAEKLRGSYWARRLSYDALLEQLRSLPRAEQTRPEIVELVALLERARALDHREDVFEAEQPLVSMSFDEVPILR